MGGIGSGRKRDRDKFTTDDAIVIDAAVVADMPSGHTTVNGWTGEASTVARIGGLPAMTIIWGEQFTSGARRTLATSEEVSSIGLQKEPTVEGNVAIQISYSIAYKNEVRPITETILLNTTQPHLGGRRWWFICPYKRNRRQCGKRVKFLYLPPSGRTFGCRECHRLLYRPARNILENIPSY